MSILAFCILSINQSKFFGLFAVFYVFLLSICRVSVDEHGRSYVTFDGSGGLCNRRLTVTGSVTARNQILQIQYTIGWN